MAKTVLAIDPGSSKCGLALVVRSDSGDLQLLWRAICPRGELAQKMVEAQQTEPFSIAIVGSGTTSQELLKTLREEFPSLSILVVDEKNTTLEARERYWEHHPRRGWRRLVPSTLQMPPEPIDDFAAYVLAERVLLES